jgi:hypothetical protein
MRKFGGLAMASHWRDFRTKSGRTETGGMSARGCAERGKVEPLEPSGTIVSNNFPRNRPYFYNFLGQKVENMVPDGSNGSTSGRLTPHCQRSASDSPAPTIAPSYRLTYA